MHTAVSFSLLATCSFFKLKPVFWTKLKQAAAMAYENGSGGGSKTGHTATNGNNNGRPGSFSAANGKRVHFEVVDAPETWVLFWDRPLKTVEHTADYRQIEPYYIHMYEYRDIDYCCWRMGACCVRLLSSLFLWFTGRQGLRNIHRYSKYHAIYSGVYTQVQYFEVHAWYHHRYVIGTSKIYPFRY